MKIGVVFYHSNIKHIYKDRWVNKSVSSILNQSYKNFSIYEIDYSGNGNSIIPKNEINKKFWSLKLSNYAEAMNFIISKSFFDGCDIVFNTNLDDYYDEKRLEIQISKMTLEEYDILSSDFCYIEEDLNDDLVKKYMNIIKYGDIRHNLMMNHNVIAHPCVCYSRRFWSDLENRYYVSKTPSEDLDLWKRSISRGYKFGIDSNILLYYRIHNNQVSKNKKRT